MPKTSIYEHCGLDWPEQDIRRPSKVLYWMCVHSVPQPSSMKQAANLKFGLGVTSGLSALRVGSGAER